MSRRVFGVVVLAADAVTVGEINEQIIAARAACSG
jgi:hypothetical protein